MTTVPLSGTNIRLLSNVPFSNDYKHSRWFTNISSQTNYFLSKPVVHSESQYNFQRIEGKHFMAVSKDIDSLWGVNYIMFQNADYNNKWFYGFVTHLEYRQRNNTHVHFEIDVLQTWKFDMNFKPSYVVREHRPLWGSNGLPVINTIDEGLDYGTDYETVEVLRYVPDLAYLVVVMKEVRHGGGFDENEGIQPIRNGVPQPLTYYIHPFRLNTGTSPNISIGGSTREIHNVLDVIKGISTSENAVNNVVTAYITDHIGIDENYSSNTLELPSNSFEVVTFATHGDVEFRTIYVKNIANYQRKEHNLGNKYSGYQNVTESKLLMYPYTSLVLEDFRGNRVEYKNEFIDGSNLILTSMGSMGTNNKVSYSFKNYLTKNLNNNDRNSMSLENALINNSPNDIPVINDYLSAFMQGNRNSIEMQRVQQIRNMSFSLASGVVSGGVNPQSALGVSKGAVDGITQLQKIQAKIKDINNIPPQMERMGGNVNFEYGNQYYGVYIIKKQIREEYRKILSDFFNMFGYKTNEVKIPNFRTRQNWNYVETLNCVITGNFNNSDLQELKNIFDRGITLWHTDDIGNYSLANGVR